MALSKIQKITISLFLFGQLSLFGGDETLSLDEYIVKHHGPWRTEGHCIEGHENFFDDLFELCPHIKLVGEIGFNAGNSSEMFLKQRPDIQVIAFDIMDHSYARAGKGYIDLHYPGRHTLIEGDSHQTLPQFYEDCPNVRFDLIFIDGDHSSFGAKKDILDMAHFATPDTLVIMDDLHIPSVRNAWNECIEKKVIEQLEIYSQKENRRTWALGKYLIEEGE